MHISVTKFGGIGDLLTVQIASDLMIRDLKAVIESETDFGISANQMNLYHDGRLLHDDNQTLAQANVKDYDLITCQQKPSNDSPNSPGATGHLHGPQQLFNELRANPNVLQQLRRTQPELADAVQRNDMNAFMQYLMNRMGSQRMQHPGELDLLDPRIQRRIEENINMENVIDNMEHAYEHAPEFFGNVVMLYIVGYSKKYS
jgi:DNA damage-inducible protein 1